MNVIKSHVLVSVVLLSACIWDTKETTTEPVGQFGQSGSGYTAQCSGWFPDWISSSAPPAGKPNFQLSQGYYRGIPKFSNATPPQLVGWDPPSAATSISGYPWLAYDPTVGTDQVNYLDAILGYSLEGMVAVDFVAHANSVRRWYHVPMMTTHPTKRREPFHGLTRERPLNSSDHSWITSDELRSYAVGFYNSLGGYTIGQVFSDPNPNNSDPSKGKFIPGALVYKLIFAEYDASKISSTSNPLLNAPEWEMQNPDNPTGTPLKVRLLQVDVAVRDTRATETGWVFATFVYDETKLTTEPDAWKRLTAVGLQWGNEMNGVDGGTVDESWLNSSLPSVFGSGFGSDGRLNGPVDNPRSSCMSCHSTAQIFIGQTQSGGASFDDLLGVRMVPDTGCSPSETNYWFRNVPAGTPFGQMSDSNISTTANDGCKAPTGSPPSTLHSLDYSLQLKDGLISSLYYDSSNPCADDIPPEYAPGAADQALNRILAEGSSARSSNTSFSDAERIDDRNAQFKQLSSKPHHRLIAVEQRREVKIETEQMETEMERYKDFPER